MKLHKTANISKTTGPVATKIYYAGAPTKTNIFYSKKPNRCIFAEVIHIP
jgi:hypothetical protein